MASSPWRFEWRRSWGDVFETAFVARWDALRASDPAATVYRDPRVVRAWAETCGEAIGCEPLFGVATCDGTTILLPWIVATHRGRIVTRRAVESAGQDLFGYDDPLVAAREGHDIDWEQFWSEVRQAVAPFGHQVLMRSVRADRAGRVQIDAEPAPLLHLDAERSLDDLLASCSANHRGDVQRRIRRLSERGDLQLHVFARAESTQASATFPEFCVAYETRREHRPQYPALERPGLRELLHRVATDGVAEGWGQLSMLTVSGEPVAWHLGLFDERGLYWWVPAHAHTWEPLSPGKVLLTMLIARAIEARWRAIHFMTGAQPYKLAWRPEVPSRRVIRWHAPTLTGTVLRHYDGAATA